MNTYIQKQRFSLAYRILSVLILVAFLTTTIYQPSLAQSVPVRTANTILNLPVPGTMVPTTDAFAPALIKGIAIHPDNALMFDFIVNKGNSGLEGEALKEEGRKLIKYFLAALTVPEEEMWVNLSPYEKDRIIADGLGDTEMGRDLLSQDYLLKQLTASLMYPEEELGEEFWARVYEQSYEQFGTTDIPMDTFHKIWIVPEKAVVYEHEEEASAYVLESHLKVMLEEDYLAMEHNVGAGLASSHNEGGGKPLPYNNSDNISTQIIREIILPEIEREVNAGTTFANLRQIYNSMILAAWYKQNLKESLLGQVYMDKNKTKGIDTTDKQITQKIYNQYIESFRKGVYDYIKEEYDPTNQQVIPRKYFSGGIKIQELFRAGEILEKRINTDGAMLEEVMKAYYSAGNENDVLMESVLIEKNNAGISERKIIQLTEFGVQKERLYKFLTLLEDLQAWINRDPLSNRKSPTKILNNIMSEVIALQQGGNRVEFYNEVQKNLNKQDFSMVSLNDVKRIINKSIKQIKGVLSKEEGFNDFDTRLIQTGAIIFIVAIVAPIFFPLDDKSFFPEPFSANPGYEDGGVDNIVGSSSVKLAEAKDMVLKTNIRKIVRSKQGFTLNDFKKQSRFFGKHMASDMTSGEAILYLGRLGFSVDAQGVIQEDNAMQADDEIKRKIQSDTDESMFMNVKEVVRDITKERDRLGTGKVSISRGKTEAYDKNRQPSQMLIKPEQSYNNAAIEKVFSFVQENGYVIDDIILWSEQALKDENIMEGHYKNGVEASRKGKKFLEENLDLKKKFIEESGLKSQDAYESVVIKGGLELQREGYLAKDIKDALINAEVIPLKSEVYIAKVNFKGKEMYILNGHVPYQIEHFTNQVSHSGKKAMTISFSVRPKNANSPSIQELRKRLKVLRKEFIDNAEQYGMKKFLEDAPKMINVVHLSETIIEGMAERILWSSGNMKSQPLAMQLKEGGLSWKVISYIAKERPAYIVDATRDIFSEKEIVEKIISEHKGELLKAADNSMITEVGKDIFETLEKQVNEWPTKEIAPKKIHGGINLDAKLLDLQLLRDGNGVPLPVHLQPLDQMRIQGFLPIILRMMPINMIQHLGLTDLLPGENGTPNETNEMSLWGEDRDEFYRNLEKESFTASIL